jgi:hypothetical protein
MVVTHQYDPHSPELHKDGTNMIDQIRRDIQHRLDQLLNEADKLRHALTALGSGDGSARKATAPAPAASPAKPVRRARSTPQPPSSTRAASARR